jgi:hypothetical protein
VHSRPVWPRLDFGTLATVLNQIEQQQQAAAAAELQQQQQQPDLGCALQQQGSLASQASSGADLLPYQQPAAQQQQQPFPVRWVANRLVPLLCPPTPSPFPDLQGTCLHGGACPAQATAAPPASQWRGPGAS